MSVTDNVRRQRVNFGEQRHTVFNGGDNIELGLQHGTQVLEYRRVIIGQEHSRAPAFINVSFVILNHRDHRNFATALNTLPPSQPGCRPMSFGEYTEMRKAYKSHNHAYLDTDTYRNRALEQFAKLRVRGQKKYGGQDFEKIPTMDTIVRDAAL